MSTPAPLTIDVRPTLRTEAAGRCCSRRKPPAHPSRGHDTPVKDHMTEKVYRGERFGE
jgi:hypothetical protein